MQYVTTYVDIWSAVLVLNEESDLVCQVEQKQCFKGMEQLFCYHAVYDSDKNKIEFTHKSCPDRQPHHLLSPQSVHS